VLVEISKFPEEPSSVLCSFISPNGSFLYLNKLYITSQEKYLCTVDMPPNGSTFQPEINWTKIDICYNTTLNGVPVGGLVFQGYFSYDSTTTIRSFYSADNITKNIILDASNAFLSSYLLRNNYTNYNKSTSNGIDGSRGGVYVKCLPFIKNVFVSEPYVQLRGNGVSLFDNFGPITNTLASEKINNAWGTESNGDKYLLNAGYFTTGTWTA
jgi:hypothetical protein